MADKEAAGIRRGGIPALQEIVESVGFVGHKRFVPRTFAPISGHNEQIAVADRLALGGERAIISAVKEASQPETSEQFPRRRPPASSQKWRFERCTRLFGGAAMRKLAGNHVAVFGLGGVGSYAVEALARTGVGRLTLVDFDRVCITNVNRQLHALADAIGDSKAELMGERVRGINPDITVRAASEFYDKTTSGHLLEPRPDVVIDCIDNVTAKMHLAATCLAREIPIITTLGAGAKIDPTRIRIVPLTDTHTDPLGRALRKYIRRKHAVTEECLAKVIAVFSDEPVILPSANHDGVVCGVNCVCPGSANTHHTCGKRHIIYGTAVFVTAVFGMAAAAAAVKLLLGMDPLSKKLTCDVCGNVLGEPPHRRFVRRKKG